MAPLSDVAVIVMRPVAWAMSVTAYSSVPAAKVGVRVPALTVSPERVASVEATRVIFTATSSPDDQLTPWLDQL